VDDHIPDAKKMVELSRAMTRAGVDTPVFFAIDGYWYDDDEGRSGVTVERAERELCHAAILWLLGRGFAISMDGDDFSVDDGYFNHRGDTLIDALHAAVKREVG
jgi:hypothetical protein